MANPLAKVEEVPQLVEEQLQGLEADLGGRTHLVGMLALAPLTQDLRYVLGQLGDPRNAHKSLAVICAAGNILPGELLTHLQTAVRLRGKVQAAIIINRHVAAVTEDVMAKAAPYEGACGACRGTGSLPPVPPAGPTPCETCGATGVLIYQPQFETQKLALELAQLLPKGGGLQITQQQVALGGGGTHVTDTLTKLQHLTDELLYGRGMPVVEAELLPPAEESQDASEDLA